METSITEIPDNKELARSLNMAKDIITKDYLYKLEDYEVADIPDALKELDIAEFTRIYKFKKMVSDKKESVIDKLVTVLNAAYSSNATVITLISGQKEITEYYLGVVSKDISQKSENIETQGEILKGGLTGNFPGLEMEAVPGEAKKRILNKPFEYGYVTSISGIASIRNEKEGSYEKFVQGIEHLVDALSGREYSIVVIADPVDAQQISEAKLGYEALYTQLSPFVRTSISFNETESVTVSKNHTEGITNAIGRSTSLTQNYTTSSGWSEGFGHGSSSNKNVGGLVGSALGAGVGIAAIALTGGMAAPAVAAAAYVGSQIGSAAGGGIIGSTGKNVSETSTVSRNTTESSGSTESENTSEAKQSSDTTGESEGTSHGKTIQLSNENKPVKNLLNKIDKHLERLNKCESYGAFNCAAYVISSDPETNAIVASGYNALMRGDNSSLQSSHINNWNETEKSGRVIKEYLKKFSHPLFINPANSDIHLSPASLANSYELAVSLGIPKKSINGLPVFEMASFGRNVFETNISEPSVRSIELGNIYHMGKKQDTKVKLNLKSLAMHTFVTGSTGAGKSNTVYQLLRELKKQDVHFLVIEPAKGEYKHVFGNEKTDVYGTNPYITPLLRVNPFKFPKGIHVLEHLDRLIEIFNVCWPMYAAMPAVLKDSVERAYVKSGWDLETSENEYSDELFPTFADVLSELQVVVGNSAFSQEVKDNYIGSLATRIKSLTNGIYGRIFDNDEIGDAGLFDRDVIVDLSRVGSVETKSMIMGILVMRLQEYRMTSGVMDADLNHVTVLEEAHNLLKRTSTEQSTESANLLGKSVEMLSNAIAEVRTYGEGFIIADQAPGLLDRSVIRNTNTKIIMRLPDADDRSLVGKAANLTDEQIKELSKLPTGVAAVYQNNWLEPVLCKVDYLSSGEVFKSKPEVTTSKSSKNKEVLVKLLNKAAGERFDLSMPEIIKLIIQSTLPTVSKANAIRLLSSNGKLDESEISPLVYDMIVTPDIEKEADGSESIEEWRDVFVYSGDGVVSDLTKEQQDTIIECILREQIARYDKPDEYLTIWSKFVKGEVI